MGEKVFKQESRMAVMEQAQILEGRTFAKEVRSRLKLEAAAFAQQHGFPPGLAVVLIGDDPSSIAYTGTLIKNASDLGFYASSKIMPATTSLEEVQTALGQLNQDRQIHGIAIQWPTPPHISFEEVTKVLDPRKDVDGTLPLSLGRLFSRLDSFVPATPLGGISLLEYYGYNVAGKACLLVGCGVTVGRPLLALLLAAHASIMIANKSTPRETLRRFAQEADFIFTASGVPGIINGSMVKPGVVVVDFGTSSVDGKLVGDADFESLLPVARAVTPTPGGTGPMTNVTLLNNVLKAARQQVS